MARKHGKKNLIYTLGVVPTKERQGQDGGVAVDIIHEKNDGKIYIRRHRAKFESILDAYLWHGIIDGAHYEAGLKFGREYARSVLKIKLYDLGAGAHGDVEMATLSAINGNAILRAAFSLLSLQQRAMLISVCVENKRVGLNRGHRLLKKTLHILAVHWGMTES